MNSLRFRLLALVGLVVAAAVISVAYISSRATTTAFSKFILESRLPGPSPGAGLDRLGNPLEAHFISADSWEGVGPLVDQLARELDGRLLLLDREGRVAAASDPDLAAAEVTLQPNGVRLAWTEADDPSLHKVLSFKIPRLDLRGADGGPCGTAIIVPGLPPDVEQAAETLFTEQDFLGTVNRWLLAGTIGVGLLMLLVTWIAARRLLRPVEELTRAANEMARGNMDCRVPAESRDELGRLARTFNTMADNLTRVETLRRNMVSDIAHELRTPLTNIRCLLEAIQDGLAEPTPETIDSIHEETMLLGRLVHDLQELALVEAGQLPLEPVPVDVGVEIGAAVKPLAADRGADAPGVELDLPNLPRGWFDPVRLRQVVRNLVENALNHTPAGGTVTVSAETVDETIRVSVADTGPGISSDDLPQIFERFYRADRARARDRGGTGLGLTIVRQLVEAQGGRVWAESEPGQGSVFRFSIPLAEEG